MISVMKEKISLEFIRDKINEAIKFCQDGNGILTEDPKIFLFGEHLKKVYERISEYANSKNHDIEHWQFSPTHIDNDYQVHIAGIPFHPNAKPEAGTEIVEKTFSIPVPLEKFIK